MRFELLGRFSDKMTLANALFSNVPGPRQPVYVANGLMTESIPMIPAVDILAVSGGITSVHNTITLGFHCDGAVVTEPDVFITGLERGLHALQVAAGLAQPTRKKTAARKKPVAKKRPARKPAKPKTAAAKPRSANATSNTGQRK